MNHRTWILLLLVLGSLLVGCSQTATPSLPATATLPEATPLPTATQPSPPPAAATASPLPPSPTPSPSPSPTPVDVNWTRFPNRLDFRAVLASGDALWLAARSGLARLELDEEAWTIWTEADGLADNVLTSLAEQDGRLWIGTQAGVTRFDPSTGEWQRYSTDDGLSSNRNIQVVVNQGTVWAGTQNGLSWYRPATDEWESLFSVADIEMAGVLDLVGDESSLWVSVSPAAGSGSALLQLDLETDEWRSLSMPAGESFHLAQNETLLWAIPQTGQPWEYNKSSGNWRPVLEINSQTTDVEVQYTEAVFYEGALWLYARHSNELVRYEPSSHRVGRYAAAPLAELGLQGKILPVANTLWFVGEQGLLSFDLEIGEWQSWRQGVGAVYSIQGERGGTLLVRTDLGPGFWEPGSGHWQPLAPVGGQIQEFPAQAAMDQTAQSVWLADLTQEVTENTVLPILLYYQRPGVEPQRFEVAPPAGWRLLRMLPDSMSNTLWFLGSRGFLSYNVAINQWGVFEIDDELGARVQDVQQLANQVWFVTDTELGQFDTTTGAYSLLDLPASSSGQAMLALSPDVVWVLLNNSLFGWSPAEGNWDSLELGAPCLDEATSLAYWQNALWLGGTNGVGRSDLAGGGWICYASGNGMLDNEFATLYPSDNALWFSHPVYGIWRFQASVGP